MWYLQLKKKDVTRINCKESEINENRHSEIFTAVEHVEAFFPAIHLSGNKTISYSLWIDENWTENLKSYLPWLKEKFHRVTAIILTLHFTQEPQITIVFPVLLLFSKVRN